MRIIEKCNRPKLFMITGRNGLYFLLRLGRLSYAIGFQSETLLIASDASIMDIADNRSSSLISR